MKKAIIAFALAIALVVPSKNSALGKEASPESNTTSQCQLLQQALIIELHPQIMSVLHQKYHDNFLFANTRVLPITNSDFLEFAFMLELVVSTGGYYETVRITFRRDGIKGYKVDDFKVVSKVPRECC